ncbi:hypothetical protein ACROYT_G025893 [Oculina patagonica]
MSHLGAEFLMELMLRLQIESSLRPRAPAAGRYRYLDGSQVILTGVARGCINCADKKKACEDYLVAFNGLQNWVLLDCNIECCTEDNCNDQYVTVISSTPTPTGTGTTPPPFSQGVQATTKGSVDSSGNGNPFPIQWIIIIVLVGVLLIASAVIFVWYRRRKARRNAERSRAAEETAQYNYILDEIKNNSSLPLEKTTHSGIMKVNGIKIPPALPPRPRYISVDPSTLKLNTHERRNSGMYEELNFGTVNDGLDYENPDEFKAENDEYVEPLNNTNLPTGNPSSNVCDNRDQDKSELDEYLEPLNETSLPTGNPSSSVGANHGEEKSELDEYLEPLNDTNLPTGNPSSNVCDNRDQDKSELDEYLEPLNETSLPTGNPLSSVGATHDEEKSELDEYLEPLNNTNLPTGNPSSNVCDNPDEDKSELDEYLEPLNETSLPTENPSSSVGANPNEGNPELEVYLEPLDDTSLPTGTASKVCDNPNEGNHETDEYPASEQAPEWGINNLSH